MGTPECIEFLFRNLTCGSTYGLGITGNKKDSDFGKVGGLGYRPHACTKHFGCARLSEKRRPEEIESINQRG